MCTVRAVILAVVMLATPVCAQTDVQSATLSEDTDEELTPRELYEAIYYDEQNATTDDEVRELAA